MTKQTRRGALKALLAAMIGVAGIALPVRAAEEPPLVKQVAKVSDEMTKKIEAALPEKAPAQPKKAHKVLVYGNANGFVHSSIPVGQFAIAELGKKTGAYTATVTDDPAAFDDLKEYDAVVLVSTTGHFMIPKGPDIKKDTPPEQKKQMEAEAKEKTKAYHDAEKQRMQNLFDFVKGGKGLLGIHAASDACYDIPEWGNLIGGYFNGHPWQHVTYKFDDAKSPLTAMFHKDKPFELTDETYTFKKEPWSREHLHVLASIDVSKLPEAEAKKENRPFDHDYGLSWVHRYGEGRVFYAAHGHKEEIYWNPIMLEHYLAGMQYVLGDLPADDAPSRPGVTEGTGGLPAQRKSL